MDPNFLQRIKNTNIFQNQLKLINDETKKNFIQFLQSRLQRMVNNVPSVRQFIQQLNFNQNEKNFFQQIKHFVGQTKIDDTKLLQNSIYRGQQRASQFKKLIKEKKLNISLNNKVIADIGSGNGIISKEFSKMFNVKQCDMYEPYVQEVPIKGTGHCKFNFYNKVFSGTNQTYDMIMLSSSLHHIYNPIQTMRLIKSSLKKGGYIFIREHLPEDDQQKMFLYLQEKTWSLSLTQEEDYDQFKNKTHPQEAYFTKEELQDLIQLVPLGVMQEDNYITNGYANYMIYKVE